jgi:hypothetical protein
MLVQVTTVSPRTCCLLAEYCPAYAQQALQGSSYCIRTVNVCEPGNRESLCWQDGSLRSAKSLNSTLWALVASIWVELPLWEDAFLAGIDIVLRNAGSLSECHGLGQLTNALTFECVNAGEAVHKSPILVICCERAFPLLNPLPTSYIQTVNNSTEAPTGCWYAKHPYPSLLVARV